MLLLCVLEDEETQHWKGKICLKNTQRTRRRRRRVADRRIVYSPAWNHTSERLIALPEPAHHSDIDTAERCMTSKHYSYWWRSTQTCQLITQETLTMRQSTPLLKAAALMLTHDLNQLAVTNTDGQIVGSVSHSIVARHLPRFILWASFNCKIGVGTLCLHRDSGLTPLATPLCLYRQVPVSSQETIL